MATYGPAGTTPGGTWHKKSNTAIQRDPCAAIFCCVLCCDCSVVMIMCCPLDEEFVYKDPANQQLRNEKGHVLTADSIKACTEVTSAEELQALQDKYSPMSAIDRT